MHEEVGYTQEVFTKLETLPFFGTKRERLLYIESKPR